MQDRPEAASQGRLHQLEQRFGELMTRLADSPEKDGFSILHGMLQEVLRQSRRSSPPSGGGETPTDIAQLYRQAPKMEAPARHAPLPPGAPAPDFALPDASGRIVRLSEQRGRPVVLVFYPLDWSPGCSQQLDLYSHEHDQFARRRATVIGVSVDSIYSHGAWAAVRRIPFPLLADFHPKGDVARQYGVYRDEDGYSERALYVIDERGIIRHSHVSPYLHHVPDIYDLFAALDALSGGAVGTAAGAAR
jgi:peroxiredoxin